MLAAGPDGESGAAGAAVGEGSKMELAVDEETLQALSQIDTKVGGGCLVGFE